MVASRITVVIALVAARACGLTLRPTPTRRLASRVRAEPETAETAPAAVEAAAAAPEAAPELTERQKEIARLRAAEKFMEKETGECRCRVCDFVYDPAAEGVAFADLASSWRCPRCKSSKDAFDATTITIAGFAENQGYGFGGNSMTEGDKNTLIFGGIGFFFALLLSGYLLT